MKDFSLPLSLDPFFLIIKFSLRVLEKCSLMLQLNVPPVTKKVSLKRGPFSSTMYPLGQIVVQSLTHPKSQGPPSLYNRSKFPHYTLQTWRWRQHEPPKLRYLPISHNPEDDIWTVWTEHCKKFEPYMSLNSQQKKLSNTVYDENLNGWPLRIKDYSYIYFFGNFSLSTVPIGPYRYLEPKPKYTLTHFNPEDGSSIFLRNAGNTAHIHMMKIRRNYMKRTSPWKFEINKVIILLVLWRFSVLPSLKLHLKCRSV
jgi:hypothetical protein